MAAPAGSGAGWWAREKDVDEQAGSGARVSRCYCYGRHLPRERDEYAARRALFLRTYRFTTRGEEEVEEEEEEGLRGRVARRLREAGVSGRGVVAWAASRARWWLGAGLARAWRARRHRRHPVLGLGCFGGSPVPCSRRYYYLHGFA